MEHRDLSVSGDRQTKRRTDEQIDSSRTSPCVKLALVRRGFIINNRLLRGFSAIAKLLEISPQEKSIHATLSYANSMHIAKYQRKSSGQWQVKRNAKSFHVMFC